MYPLFMYVILFKITHMIMIKQLKDMYFKRVIRLKNWVTVQEAAEQIGLSKPTIYKYVREGKLEDIPDPHRLFGEKRITQQSVQQLIEERSASIKKGKTPHELAKQFNIPPHFVYEAIRELQLQPRKRKQGKRDLYDLSKTECEQITRHIESIGAEPLFYDSTHDVALYQKMEVSEGQTLRVVWHEEKKEWGAYMHGSIWMPLQSDWKPCYPIHREVMRAADTITFTLSMQQSDTWETIDWIYTNFGVENCKVSRNLDTLTVHIKTGVVTLRETANHSIIGALQDGLQSGQFMIEENVWHAKGTKRQTSLLLDEAMIEEVKTRARQNGETMNEWIERAIAQQLS